MSDTAEAIAQARKAVEPDKPKHVLRTLGHSIREYKKASILAPVFVAVEGILEILIPTIMASLIAIRQADHPVATDNNPAASGSTLRSSASAIPIKKGAISDIIPNVPL